MLKFKLKSNKAPARTCFRGGFTLLEALVATSILMVAVAAPITIAQKGLSSAVYSKNQMIASYLVQDAIEYIKNVRDENFIFNIGKPVANQIDWLTRLDLCSSLCEVDTVNGFSNGVYIRASAGELMKKKRDVNGNFEFFGYESGEGTNFRREVNITEIEVDVSALITATVGWSGGEVEVKTLIYNI